jgi:hypothetical protein
MVAIECSIEAISPDPKPFPWIERVDAHFNLDVYPGRNEEETPCEALQASLSAKKDNLRTSVIILGLQDTAAFYDTTLSRSLHSVFTEAELTHLLWPHVPDQYRDDRAEMQRNCCFLESLV